MSKLFLFNFIFLFSFLTKISIGADDTPWYLNYTPTTEARVLISSGSPSQEIDLTPVAKSFVQHVKILEQSARTRKAFERIQNTSYRLGENLEEAGDLKGLDLSGTISSLRKQEQKVYRSLVENIVKSFFRSLPATNYRVVGKVDSRTNTFDARTFIQMALDYSPIRLDSSPDILFFRNFIEGRFTIEDTDIILDSLLLKPPFYKGTVLSFPRMVNSRLERKLLSHSASQGALGIEITLADLLFHKFKDIAASGVHYRQAMETARSQGDQEAFSKAANNYASMIHLAVL